MKFGKFGTFVIVCVLYVILMRLFLAFGLVVFETNNSLSEFLICSVNIIENAGVFFFYNIAYYRNVLLIDTQFDVILEIEDKYLKILDFTYGITWVYVLGLEKMDKATMEKLKQFYEDWNWKKKG